MEEANVGAGVRRRVTTMAGHFAGDNADAGALRNPILHTQDPRP